MKVVKNCILFCFVAGVLLLLSGCFMRGSDELYCVPKRSNAYLSLQEEVEAAIGDGEYCAPTAGENRQAIQQADLDGNGREEYIVYARTGEEKPLKIFIFQSSGKGYSLQYTIEGDGNTFDSVSYAQVDGAAGMELIVGRRVGDQVPQALAVYTFSQNQVTELVSTNYTDFGTKDLDEDGLTDLFVVRSDTEQRNAVAELYRWQEGELARDNEANLSTPAEQYKRTIIGNLTDGTPAFFVASTYDENNIVTDVLTLKDGVFRNITISAESGVSTSTVRNYYVYSMDIDGDGCTEIPSTELLASVPWDAQTESQYLIRWHSIDANGSRTEKLCTYHNYADGWYLVIPETWTSNLMVSRRMQETSMGYVFYRLQSDEKAERFLSIYAVKGEDAESSTDVSQGVVLAAWNGTSYVAFADAGGIASGISAEKLQGMFHGIVTETGTSESNLTP